MTRAEVLAHRENYAKKSDGKFVGPWADPDEFEAMA